MLRTKDRINILTRCFRVAQVLITYNARTKDSLSFKHDTVDGWLYTPKDKNTRTEYEDEDEEGNHLFKKIRYTPLGTSLSSLIRGEHVLQLSERELDSIRDSRLALERTLGKIGMGQREISSELTRSEERRVGKECRSRWSPYH